jgi:hypothetical protein
VDRGGDDPFLNNVSNSNQPTYYRACLLADEQAHDRLFAQSRKAVTHDQLSQRSETTPFSFGSSYTVGRGHFEAWLLSKRGDANIPSTCNELL